MLVGVIKVVMEWTAANKQTNKHILHLIIKYGILFGD
jgi:hypothetical protein